MSYNNIVKLKESTPVKSCLYFLDAQIWVYATQSFNISNEHWQLRYVNFFQSIIDNDLAVKPKILLNSLLLSEIINTYMKQIAFVDYCTCIGKPTNEVSYKKEYRNDEHYKRSFKYINDEIKSYRSVIEFVDDKHIVNLFPEFLKSDILPFDLNDYYFYLTCKEYSKENELICITNDGDFLVNDIDILTYNKDLLSAKYN